jgi:SAM-dependent methyltransferase
MNCLLCESDKGKIFAQVESFGYPLVYYQCENCGLIYQSLEESQAANPEFYRKTYRKIYQADEKPGDKDIWIQEKRANHLVSIVHDQMKDSPGRVLDIGASTGTLLNKMRDRFGCEVFGVEPGDAYRAFAKDRGIEMLPSLGALIDSRVDKFDLISISHVLEHFADPVNELIRIRTELLDGEGYLLVEVPNFYAHDSYELAHLTCFTPHTLRELLKQAGFKVIFMKKHGVPRSELLNLYLTVLAKASLEFEGSHPVKKENMVGTKRKLGLLYRRLMQKLFPHKAWLPISVIDEG